VLLLLLLLLQVPSAHRGFLARSKAVPIQQLLALAQGSGRRLVLCGHSLVSLLDAGWYQHRLG
jgi:hypothetical protein